jgi:hypothetical protein
MTEQGQVKGGKMEEIGVYGQLSDQATGCTGTCG